MWKSDWGGPNQIKSLRPKDIWTSYKHQMKHPLSLQANEIKHLNLRQTVKLKTMQTGVDPFYNLP